MCHDEHVSVIETNKTSQNVQNEAYYILDQGLKRFV